MQRSSITLALLVACGLGNLGGCAVPIIGAAEPSRVIHRSSDTGAERSPGQSLMPPRRDTAQPPSQAVTVRVPATPAAARAAAAGPATPQAGNTRACYERLWRSGTTFELIDADRAQGIRMPIRLTSPIGGVEITARNGKDLHAMIDCRLALQLLAWSPSLRAAGVVELQHYSVYRPGARTPKGRRSGHASGLAIDLAALRTRDGRTLEVLTDWEERGRGEAPCPRRSHEAWRSRVLRGTVCDAIDQSLFHVVLTPHHDKAHQNHVHLEIKPSTNWTYVR